MGEHNALKYFPALARLGERNFGVDDNEQSVTRLSETLQGVVDLYGIPEFAFHKGERRFACSPSQPAVAAEFSHVGVVNPVQNQYLVTIDSYSVIGLAGAQSVTTRFTGRVFNALSFTGSAPVTPTDLRDATAITATPGTNAVSITQHQAALLGFGLLVHFIGAGFDQPWQNVPIILPPGCAFLIAPAAVNTPIAASFIGREHRAFPGELLP